MSTTTRQTVSLDMLTDEQLAQALASSEQHVSTAEDLGASDPAHSELAKLLREEQRRRARGAP